ncbi:MAG TPA: GGDEF domain-containing protein [Xanthomonadaceae bacterium]|nr:GGDEF domain-containing protein [Xanthomonadaceae bacterium]
MARGRMLTLMLAVALSGGSWAARAGTLDQMLAHAEAVRSTDPKAFAAALDDIDRARSRATPSQLRQLRLLRAYQKVVTGHYDDAIREAQAIYEESGEPPLRFRAALLVANGAAITRDFSLGMRYLENALALQDQVGDRDLRHLGFVVAAILYNQYGQFALGQHYAQQVLDQPTSPRNHCIAQQLRVEALFGQNAALEDDDLTTAIAECDAQKEPIASNLIRGYLARHWVAQRRSAEAIRVLESHLAEVEATGYPRLIGEIHGLLAEYRLNAGDTAGAEQDARSALTKGEKDAYSLPLVTAHKVLYEVALRRGDLPAALGEYRAYAEADKARLDEIKAREYAFQLSRNELQQKNQAIQLLSKQNEVLRLQQEVTRTSAQNSQLLIGLLGFVLVTVGYWAFKIKRVQMRFRHLAQTDALTGICNRAHLRQQAEVALTQCSARGRPVGMLVFDLDNFKTINDRHGHASGDWVLERVSRAIGGACREGDLFGRLGGEEFGLVLPDRDIAATERMAEDCRAALAAIDTVEMGERFTVTASFGCVDTDFAGYDYERLLALADEAMYSAKHGGRDCVRRYGDAPVRTRKPPVLVTA